MKANMGEAFERVIFYPRSPNSDHFLSMISVVDVMLHPFPFDGSKTSADSLAMGLPMVTWPSVSTSVFLRSGVCLRATQRFLVMGGDQKFLRGRMGHSFYHSMGFHELVAHSADEYVSIAVKLGTDPAYRRRCSHIIKRLSHVIWQRTEVYLEWELFLLTAVGYDKRVRTASRLRLEAVQRQDAEHISEMHRVVAAELAELAKQPLPLPVSVPPRFSNIDTGHGFGLVFPLL
jgi:hypothetical protein